MEILKKGDLNRTIPLKEFECEDCWGVFVATSDKYRPASYIENTHAGIVASCECPCCKRVVYSYR